MPVADRVHHLQERMAAACARRGRAESSVRLLAATKTVAPEAIREAYAAGLRLFGENRVQERQAKLAKLADLGGVEWHLLGPLQSNKAARAAAIFDTLEAVDSVSLAQRLDRLAAALQPPRPLRVLIEVNVGGEAQKHGVAPSQALDLAQAIAGLPRLRLGGLMTVPPYSESPEASRPHFAALAALGERVRTSLATPGDEWDLSMGMSHDFEIAIEEGATLVRIGTAIFGARLALGPKP